MKVTVIGTGYVGLVAGTCFADLGNNVICLDVDSEKIAKLNSGVVPIYEPGLESMLKRNIASGSIEFTTDKKYAISSSDVIFIAVGTPMGQNHEADLRFVRQVAKDIGTYLNGYKVIVNKSTVPVGTADLVKEIISSISDLEFDVVSNPEFLKEGAAVKDFMNPDRVVIGTSSSKATEIMKELYAPITSIENPLLIVDVKSSELIKYASNAMLATRISFMNELSHLASAVGADINKIALGMGLDERIGPKFLSAGIGYGGSCFPKDVQALIQTMKHNNCSYRLLESVEDVNDRQKIFFLPALKECLDLSNSKIGIWGLAFKPNTDDIREAPAISIVNRLVDLGASVVVFDPIAMDNFKRYFDFITYAKNPYEAVADVDALLVLTDWSVFKGVDLAKVKSLMKGNCLLDGRNMYDPSLMKSLGFHYKSIGR